MRRYNEKFKLKVMKYNKQDFKDKSNSNRQIRTLMLVIWLTYLEAGN